MGCFQSRCVVVDQGLCWWEVRATSAYPMSTKQLICPVTCWASTTYCRNFSECSFFWVHGSQSRLGDPFLVSVSRNKVNSLSEERMNKVFLLRLICWWNPDWQDTGHLSAQAVFCVSAGTVVAVSEVSLVPAWSFDLSLSFGRCWPLKFLKLIIM